MPQSAVHWRCLQKVGVKIAINTPTYGWCPRMDEGDSGEAFVSSPSPPPVPCSTCRLSIRLPPALYLSYPLSRAHEVNTVRGKGSRAHGNGGELLPCAPRGLVRTVSASCARRCSTPPYCSTGCRDGRLVDQMPAASPVRLFRGSASGSEKSDCRPRQIFRIFIVNPPEGIRSKSKVDFDETFLRLISTLPSSPS